MNDVQRRQKALAVVRDMDTDAIVEMIQLAPEGKIPTPAFDELMQTLAKEEETPDLDAELFMNERTPDLEITEIDRSMPQPGLRASEVISQKFVLGQGPLEPDKSRIMFAGPGKMEAEKLSLDDLDTPDAEYLGKLYESDGSDRENYSDDESWI